MQRAASRYTAVSSRDHAIVTRRIQDAIFVIRLAIDSQAPKACRRCRYHHFHCDEKKPQCGWCKWTGRECSWGPDKPSKQGEASKAAVPGTTTGRTLFLDPIASSVEGLSDAQESDDDSDDDEAGPQSRSATPTPSVTDVESDIPTPSSDTSGLECPTTSSSLGREMDLSLSKEKVTDSEIRLSSRGETPDRYSSAAPGITSEPQSPAAPEQTMMFKAKSSTVDKTVLISSVQCPASPESGTTLEASNLTSSISSGVVAVSEVQSLSSRQATPAEFDTIQTQPEAMAKPSADVEGKQGAMERASPISAASSDNPDVVDPLRTPVVNKRLLQAPANFTGVRGPSDVAVLPLHRGYYSDPRNGFGPSTAYNNAMPLMPSGYPMPVGYNFWQYQTPLTHQTTQQWPSLGGDTHGRMGSYTRQPRENWLSPLGDLSHISCEPREWQITESTPSNYHFNSVVNTDPFTSLTQPSIPTSIPPSGPPPYGIQASAGQNTGLNSLNNDGGLDSFFFPGWYDPSRSSSVLPMDPYVTPSRP
ncbi:hypothetical protein BKA70DRAFT_1432972 [Coprinopsis sp. MPI-PUGE-AT-0042]|nr:hypothetical protein BKA70DRAFT_1432972 [Coprinopsis sp. MPI-PUGE-AT-0042]